MTCAHLIEVPLNLPYVRVLRSNIDDRNLTVTVESTLRNATCPNCGELITELHSYDDPILLRHLPCLGLKTWIELRPKRFICRRCPGDPTAIQQVSWYEPHSHNTKAFDNWLAPLYRTTNES